MLFAFMSLPRRILTTVAITLGVIALGAFYVAPVALSFDAARKAPPAARVVPTNLKDLSVSQVPGTKVSYVGYEFEIPWTDLDQSQIRSVPKDHPEMVASGLPIRIALDSERQPTAHASKRIRREWKISPQKLESFFGRGSSQSDYSFLENLYEFTPEKMHRWGLSAECALPRADAAHVEDRCLVWALRRFWDLQYPESKLSRIPTGRSASSPAQGYSAALF